MARADDSFVEKLTTQIIKNVEVKIGEIHIRYEDRISNLGRPFALGVTLYNLAVQTTDSQWKKCIKTEATNFIFKVGSVFFSVECREKRDKNSVRKFDKWIAVKLNMASPRGQWGS